MRTTEPTPGGRDVETARLLTVPNVLSLIRLGTVPVFVYLFATGRENAAVALYAAGAGTDFLDGYLARRLKQVSEFGKLLDPLADRIFIVALCVALVLRDTLPLWLALAIVGRDLLLLAAFPVLERKGVERIRVNFVGKSATAALLFGLTWLALSETSVFLRAVADEIGFVFTVGGAVLYWVAAVMYAQQARARIQGAKGA